MNACCCIVESKFAKASESVPNKFLRAERVHDENSTHCDAVPGGQPATLSSLAEDALPCAETLDSLNKAPLKSFWGP